MIRTVNKLSRRRFLSRTSALAAAACLPALSTSAHARQTDNRERPSPVHIGMCSYTFRTMSRAQLIAAMKDLRLTALNAKDVKDHLPSTSPEAEREALADYAANGITLTAVGTVAFTKDEDDDIRKKFDYAKLAGVKVIVAGDPAPTTLPRIEKFVKEYDIRFAIHNHGPEDKVWPSPLTVLAAVENMDPRMGCCIDVGHTMRSGTDVVEAIRKVGPRLFDMHMKDLALPNVRESQVAVGAGIMPVHQIFETLIQIGYPGHVDLEYEIHPDNPLPGAIESIAYERGVLDGMGYRA
jgi:sugar phosphate isomerase/epimerase